MDLKSGRQVSDGQFDAIYPQSLQKVSKVHWTPIEVILRAKEMLNLTEKTRLLDVGSGCGKFCLVSALTSPGRFFGIEQRSSLNDVAIQTAKDFNLEHRLKFMHGKMEDLDWSYFNVFYLFNPFYEHIAKRKSIDNTIGKDSNKYYGYVSTVRLKLAALKTGTKVLTYHGFGGDLPSDYACLENEKIWTDELKLWIKL